MPIPYLSEFTNRRQQLMSSIGQDAVAIVSAAPEYLRNGDSHYPYRQNSNFYYLTGFSEPEAIAVLIPKENKFILFNRLRDPAQETWTGRRAGQTGACEEYGANEAYPIHEFKNKLLSYLSNYKRVCIALGQNLKLDTMVAEEIKAIREKSRSGTEAPLAIVDLESYLQEMRLFKSPLEIEWMRKAAEISAQAHIVAMQNCRPGMYEYELEADLLHEFYRQGSRFPAYTSIVGSGENTCILHYSENNAELKSGDLVLIDAGCEYQCYASDITRTFPVNGRFTPEQKAIYDIVLQAQLAAINAVKPGVRWDVMQEICARTITEGLVALGILKGTVNELIAKNAYFDFYMHRSGHWLGMDVHDVGAYKVSGEWRELEPGMVFTVEPGIYIAANNPNVDKKWWNIGVRIEDDVLVTANGCEVLSAKTPKQVADIEALMV